MTSDEVQKGLDIIPSHTDGSDGKFDYTQLVSEGVPEEVALEYAGLLQAAEESYSAPDSVHAIILSKAKTYVPVVNTIKHSPEYQVSDIDWGRVVRAVGSEVECAVAVTAVQRVWPFTYCMPNPNNNGTWLVIVI